ncbi:MAG TPA: tyrosine-type recombinase/integrase [Trebonia sp.]|jgi:site-specific recombinase XerD
MDSGNYRELISSWQLAMHAAGKAEGTQDGYTRYARQYADWCDAQGVEPDLTAPRTAVAWLASLRDEGQAGSTRQVKFGGLRAFAKWLAAEGEIERFGLSGIEWPKADETIPHAVTADDVEAMCATCDRKAFTGIRDEAIMRLLYDSMVRSDELLAMRRRTAAYAGDVDLRRGIVHVQRGKGGKERWAPFGAGTATALDRYERHRKGHKRQQLDAYWLSRGRGPMRYQTLYSMIKMRGERAGVENVHPHAERAGGSIAWRRAGGTTESLMTINGWTDPKMAMRYTRAAEQQIALEEAERLYQGR